MFSGYLVIFIITILVSLLVTRPLSMGALVLASTTLIAPSSSFMVSMTFLRTTLFVDLYLADPFDVARLLTVPAAGVLVPAAERVVQTTTVVAR